MQRVESVDELHVTLRSYQKRAVAWMLSTQLDPPSHLFNDESVTWKRTYSITAHSPLNAKKM